VSRNPPAVTARQLIRILGQHGFIRVRQSGSHAIFKHKDGRRTTVPIHSSKTLGKGLLRQILKDAGISVDDL